MANDRIYLLYLDDYHAGDAIFVRSLSQSLARTERPKFLIVHGSGVFGVQALEGHGFFRERKDGVLPVATAEEHALVERAIRHVNRKITGVLTDAVVSSVGVIGSERGLLVASGASLPDVRADWLEALVDSGVVPVVASYASEAGTGRTGEVALCQSVAALVKGLSSSATVVAFSKTKLPGVMRGGTPAHDIRIDELDERLVDDRPGLLYLASLKIPVLLTNATRVADEGGPTGTLLHSST